MELFARFLELCLILCNSAPMNLSLVTFGPMRIFNAIISMMVSSFVWYLVSYSSTFVSHIGTHDLACFLGLAGSGFITWYATV